MVVVVVLYSHIMLVVKVLSRAISSWQSIPISIHLIFLSSLHLSGWYVEEIIHVEKMKQLPVRYLFKKNLLLSALAHIRLAHTALTTVANHQLPPALL